MPRRKTAQAVPAVVLCGNNAPLLKRVREALGGRSVPCRTEAKAREDFAVLHAPDVPAERLALVEQALQALELHTVLCPELSPGEVVVALHTPTPLASLDVVVRSNTFGIGEQVERALSDHLGIDVAQRELVGPWFTAGGPSRIHHGPAVRREARLLQRVLAGVLGLRLPLKRDPHLPAQEVQVCWTSSAPERARFPVELVTDDPCNDRFIDELRANGFMVVPRQDLTPAAAELAHLQIEYGFLSAAEHAEARARLGQLVERQAQSLGIDLQGFPIRHRDEWAVPDGRARVVLPTRAVIEGRRPMYAGPSKARFARPLIRTDAVDAVQSLKEALQGAGYDAPDVVYAPDISPRLAICGTAFLEQRSLAEPVVAMVGQWVEQHAPGCATAVGEATVPDTTGHGFRIDLPLEAIRTGAARRHLRDGEGFNLTFRGPAKRQLKEVRECFERHPGLAEFRFDSVGVHASGHRASAASRSVVIRRTRPPSWPGA